MSEEVKFYVSSYVNLLRQYYLHKHFMNMRKIISKQIGFSYYALGPFRKLIRLFSKNNSKEKVHIAEINTFMIASGSFPLKKVNNVKKRKKVEKKVLKEIRRYHKQEVSFLKKKASKNKELEEYIHIFYKGIESLDPADKKKCRSMMKNNTDAKIKETMDEITKIIDKTWAIVWDYPGTENDVLVLEELVTQREENGKSGNKENADLAGLIDELILTLFARYHYNYTKKTIELLEENIKSLKEKTPSNLSKIAPKGNEVAILTLLRSTYGKITSAHEQIIQLERQLNRLRKVEIEIKNELEEMGFSEENPINSLLINEEDFTELLAKTDRIKTVLEELQNKYVGIIQLPKEKFVLEGEGETFKQWACDLCEFIPLSETLNLWVEQFSDIAEFTTTKGKIVDESEEFLKEAEKYHVYGKQLFKSYRLYSGVVHALRGVTIGIKKGEFVGILGPSGSGKTTLLNLLAGLDKPDQGKVYLNGRELTAMGDNELSEYRKKHMGFIFQTYNLIPHLYVIENTLLPAQMAKQKMKEAKTRANQLLEQMGMGEFKKQFPSKLSGGQMQRATISRALINSPEIIFCDEPTGDLDKATGEQVMAQLKELHEKFGTTVVLVTHDESLKSYCDRIIYMKDGQIISEEKIKENQTN